MRSAQECAEQARRFVRLAARERDPELKKRLLHRAQEHKALVRLANLLARLQWLVASSVMERV
jgi:hypothetical protein